jgi:hypothetical protein
MFCQTRPDWPTRGLLRKWRVGYGFRSGQGPEPDYDFHPETFYLENISSGMDQRMEERIVPIKARTCKDV